MANQRDTASDTIQRKRYSFWLDRRKPDERAVESLISQMKADRAFTPSIRNGLRLMADLQDGKLDVLFELFPWVRAEFLEYMRELQPEAKTESAQPQPQSSEPTPTPSVPETDTAWIEAEQERLDNERRWHEKRMADAEKALAAERQRIAEERAETQNNLQEQLKRLEDLLIQQGNQPITGGLTPMSGAGGIPAGPKPLPTPQFSPPSFEDDEDDFDLALNISKDENSGKQAALNFINSINNLHQTHGGIST
ncbi:MAG: hypothetical protein AAFQ07_00075 [Chloroflexota bacterium]